MFTIVKIFLFISITCIPFLSYSMEPGEDPSHRAARLRGARQNLNLADPLHARLLQLNQAIEQKEGPSRIKTILSRDIINSQDMQGYTLLTTAVSRLQNTALPVLLWLGADDRQTIERQPLLQYAWNLAQDGVEGRPHSLLDTFARFKDELFQVVNKGGSKEAIVSLINQLATQLSEIPYIIIGIQRQEREQRDPLMALIGPGTFAEQQEKRRAALRKLLLLLPLQMRDASGNNLAHRAIMSQNRNTIEVIVQLYPELLSLPNIDGERPREFAQIHFRTVAHLIRGNGSGECIRAKTFGLEETTYCVIQ